MGQQSRERLDQLGADRVDLGDGGVRRPSWLLAVRPGAAARLLALAGGSHEASVASDLCADRGADDDTPNGETVRNAPARPRQIGERTGS